MEPASPAVEPDRRGVAAADEAHRRPTTTDGAAAEEAAAEPVELDLEVARWPSGTSSRTSPCACRPTSRTTASASSAQTDDEIDRATGRLVEALLPVLDACEAAFAHGADEVEPIWSALIGALQKQGLEAHRSAGQAVRPDRRTRRCCTSRATAATSRSSPRCCAPATAWKGGSLRPAMVKVKG